jgi:hypothetical protein
MYYPKSQITPNLYTNGGEFVYADTQEAYLGYYFRISTGKYFTGKNQDDKPNVELILLQSTQTTFTPLFQNTQFNYVATTNVYEAINEEYLNLKSISPLITIIPTYSPVLPTQQDYQNGEFQRYFCKKTNEIQYIEINLDSYSKLVAKDPQIEFSLYQPFTITWILTGDKQQVAKTNKNIVDLAMKSLRLPKFNLYLKEDYTKYYQ